ncbi:MAG TPA: cyanophycin synthetase, partial [Thermoanaerobaculia bacterium]|nr:cyanophycin synthetase [Thermoanaerobaculia bacterium]
AEGSRFDLWWNGNRWGDLLSPLSGMHNVLNAAGCIAAARGLGLTEADLREGLRTFQGIRRRMEVRGVERGVIVIDDFAHHPTAIETTLAGARERYPGRRIWALYEPRSISSGRKEFEKDYARAFRQADRVIIGPIFHRARFETTYGIDQMMSVPALVEDLEQNGVLAEQVDDFDAIAETVASEAEEEDVVIAMSSGAFGGIHEKILDRLRGVALEPDR